MMLFQREEIHQTRTIPQRPTLGNGRARKLKLLPGRLAESWTIDTTLWNWRLPLLKKHGPKELLLKLRQTLPLPRDRPEKEPMDRREAKLLDLRKHLDRPRLLQEPQFRLLLYHFFLSRL